jgi:GNAT superfamily N-acetyltransferase
MTDRAGAHLRVGTLDDVQRIQAIEREAGLQFAQVGLPEIAADQPTSADHLAEFIGDERCEVAVDRDDVIVGYVIWSVLARYAHVDQIDVLPSSQGQGIGRELLAEVERRAKQRALCGLTLTTFSHVPWNRPLYERLGFRVLADEEIAPELRRVRDTEAVEGLAPALRVCMQRDIC